MNRLLPIAIIAATACSGEAKLPSLQLTASSLTRISVPVESVGLSGLTSDDRGNLWAVPEEDRQLVMFGEGGAAPRGFDLLGVSDDLELESLTWIGDDLFAIGTESERAGGYGDTILLVRVAGDVARVVGEVRVGLERSKNKGIEGLCHVSGQLIAASETVVDTDGNRSSPLARYDLKSGNQTRFQVPLTSSTGKLSGLDCWKRGDDIEVVAIERHFEVTRLLSFRVPMTGDIGDVVPAIAADLHDDKLAEENLEGVARAAGGLAIVIDNEHKKVACENRLLFVE